MLLRSARPLWSGIKIGESPYVTPKATRRNNVGCLRIVVKVWSPGKYPFGLPCVCIGGSISRGSSRDQPVFKTDLSSAYGLSFLSTALIKASCWSRRSSVCLLACLVDPVSGWLPQSYGENWLLPRVNVDMLASMGNKVRASRSLIHSVPACHKAALCWSYWVLGSLSGVLNGI